MTTAEDHDSPLREHTWEGDATQVFHCTSCGLVTTSTDTIYTCQPRPRPAPAPQQHQPG